MENNLFFKIGNLCLCKAYELLKSNTTPTAEEVEVVNRLVGIAIAIDELNRRWTMKSRSGVRAYPVLPFQRREEENSAASCAE